MKEIEIVIDTEEIAEYLNDNLIKRGFVPAEKELDELADIFFDYLVEKRIMDERKGGR